MKSLSNPPVTIPLSHHCLVLSLPDQPDGFIPDPLTLVPAGVCTVVVVNVTGRPIRGGEPKNKTQVLHPKVKAHILLDYLV